MPRERRATYRLQLNPDFGFAAAESRLEYFAELGVSHVYLSPITQATQGSTHGYDLTDPTVISEELGGAGAFRSLSQRASHFNLGLIIDLVTNHMAADAERNFWWRDVLERGQSSSYADFFDIDWEVSTSERLSYRRFADIDTLVAVNSQNEKVFNAFHELPKQLIDEGLIDGVRLDHVDGLAGPHKYLQRLRNLLGTDAWIVVEKILAHDEELPPSWPVDGTTGYEFAADVIALLTDESGKSQLSNTYERWVGDQDLAELEIDSRREAAINLVFPELARTARQFAALGHRESEGDIKSAIEDLVTRMKVYRIYADDPTTSDQASARITAALKLMPKAPTGKLSQLITASLLENKSEQGLAFATRFSQLSTAVAAKGIEDTAFYRYVRFTPHCEVGYDLERFNINGAEFLNRTAERAERWHSTLLSDSTHDSKRSADVRARLLVLAQIPEQWGKAVSRWRDLTAGVELDARTQYLFFQVLVGAWPISSDRLTPYMVKAGREAKQHTTWVYPNPEYQGTLARFVDNALGNSTFISEFEEFMEHVVPLGRLMSFIQTLLKLTLPGVPDIYQGDERWNLNLVDPDNRRPVDFDALAAGLDQADLGRPIDDPRTDDGGVSKQLLIHRLLMLRRTQPLLFDAPCRPLSTSDATGDLLAFTRGADMIVVTALFPSRTAALSSVDVQLPAGAWANVLLGTRHQGAQTFGQLCDPLPSAVLVRQSQPGGK
jgi:(1->4)-alpha-D-glucan 1-alpha-D-glucosylmutase